MRGFLHILLGQFRRCDLSQFWRVGECNFPTAGMNVYKHFALYFYVGVERSLTSLGDGYRLSGAYNNLGKGI